MLAYTEERVRKGSINMNKSIIFILLILGFSCAKNSDNTNPEPIDNVPVSITVNLNLPSNFHLQNVGSFIFLSGGVKGIVLVHHTDDNFYAFDRACSYQPNSVSCSKLEVDSAFLQFRCGQTTTQGFQKCCESRFFFDGSVSQSPARFPLKQYNITKSSNTIFISN